MTAPKPLKIMAVSLCSPKKYRAMAVYANEKLFITEVAPISGLFGTWQGPLIEDIRRAKENGFVVIVEEKTDVIAKHGTQFLLEDTNDEGRSNYFDAFDWYFALSSMDRIQFHADCQAFAISSGAEGQKVEKAQDEKGRAIYRINWQQFNGGYRAVLLSVVACMVEPVSDRFINDFCTYLGDESPDDMNPVERIAKTLEHSDRQRARDFAAQLKTHEEPNA